MFIAGSDRVPFSILSYNLWTPVVVSSESPLIPAIIWGNLSKTILVKSPPSSKIMFNDFPPSKAVSVCKIHQSNSSSFIPFQAKTGTPTAAIAAAAWSWVENILQEDHETSAPKWTNVSIKTAVWIVMCKHPAILAPSNGLLVPNSSRIAINPGISASANVISFLPHSANEMSFTL